MPTEVLVTQRAEQQIDALGRMQARAFGDFLNDLAVRGCAALGYRLSGPTPLDHLCVKHLSGSLRVVVAFESADRAWVLLVGPHDDQDPVLNVYAELYRLLGIDPPDAAGRAKPPCCEEAAEQPPVLGTDLTGVLDRAASIRKTRRPTRNRTGGSRSNAGVAIASPRSPDPIAAPAQARRGPAAR